ncbi:cellulose binding domain-containing protein [Dinghuibacter silviterrae]|uniref:Putative secreted protein (Por secretion system target) n=1 Tax=Dinghuibacter silviterrae TaxID=1539049 RepID=A0A4R8DVY6_9BACT|nr:cellulose binding domain-containing protein [Dinghuibacter silviterrae]TDX02098.1 putative secreted protein (Por secretion system target) [Dinghuibacter silviterrae]
MKLTLTICLLLLVMAPRGRAQTFVHPGGLHTQADLDRMKTEVAAGAHPWIDDWNVLITDPQAQNTYTAKPLANLGTSRQQTDLDAHAAYLNAIRWYISGDTSFAACAVRICNAWAATTNQVPTGDNIPGLSGIPIMDFALAAEVLRIYPGWDAAHFTAFKTMMTTYWYPVCHNFLVNHNGACIGNYWANWDICNLGAMIAMGVLCDDTAIYNEGVNYFYNGAGNGSIMNAVYTLYPGPLGQWQESGRDQEHAQLGVGMMGYACQVAWNQGLDLFSYASNRLMAGAEYVAETNLWNTVPFTFYNNCVNPRQDWVAANGRGRLDDRPIWELLYNHYVVLQGQSAAGVQSMAQLMRPEHGSTDHFGYGTLTFTQTGAASPYPPSPVAAAPTAVTATAQVSQVTISWTAPPGNTAQGYLVKRAKTSGGPYTTISTVNNNTSPFFTDGSVTNGTPYYYVVASINQSGTSANSSEVSATPAATSSTLPSGWVKQDIGTVSPAGSAGYASVSNNTFRVNGSGTGIGGTADGFTFACASATGNVTFTARLWAVGGTLSRTGIMFRESLASNARMVLMKLGDTGGREGGFAYRSGTGGSAITVGGNDYTVTPTWYKVQRSGNTFTGYESSDGATWFVVDSVSIAMADTFYVGLAACSGTTGVLDSSTFDNVVVTGGGATPAAPAALQGTAVSASRINLTWSSVGGASSYTVQRSLTSGGPYAAVASGLTDTTWSDTGLPDSTTYFYIVLASDVIGAGPATAEARVQTLPLALPTAPAGLTFASGNSRITLSWQPVDGATGYTIQRGTSAATLATVGATDTTFLADTGLVNGGTYVYTVSGVNRLGTGTATTPTAFTLPIKLSGALIGTPGSFGNVAKNTAAAAMDGNLATYFDAPQGSGDWVGIDLGLDTSATITRVSYVPRVNYPGRMLGGVFQGANLPDFSDAVPLYTVSVSPTQGVYNDEPVTDSIRYRYLRYVSPTNGYCNVAEIQFWGYKNIDTPTATPPAPAAPNVASATKGVALNWAPNRWSGAYQVQRATVVPGEDTVPGATTALGTTTALSFTDTTAVAGSTYSYTISGIDSFGVGAPSAPASLLVGVRLTGTLIGTPGSYGNVAANTAAAAMDGNLNTYFDAPIADSAWVGITLGADTGARVTQISFAPRSGFPQRMTGGIFQGANKSDFSDGVTLFTVDSLPTVGVYTIAQTGDTGIYHYLRYLAPDNGYGNVAEIQFWGLPKLNQVVTLDSLARMRPGDSATLIATASTGLPVTVTSSNPSIGFIANGFFHAVTPGTTVITATQSGNNVYNAASASQPLTVLPVNLQVLYRNASGDTTSNTITPFLQIVSADTAAYTYSTLTARYWFTPENYAGINTWIDYAAIGNSHIQAVYVPLAQPYTNAFGYVQYSFDTTSGLLAPGTTSGEIQSRIAGAAWPVMTETNDYSFSNSASYDTNSHITLYRNGVLVWGTEPAPVAPVVSLQPLYQNQNSSPNTNTISTYLQLQNLGNVPVSYSDVRVRYWFTEDGTVPLNYWIDYATIGVTGQFSPAGTYFELAPDTGTFYPLSNTGNIQYRIAKSDWSVFNETNDWSWQPAVPTFGVNNHITVYYKGQLVYGVEPDSSGAASYSAAYTPALQQTVVYPNPVTGRVFFVQTGGSDTKLNLYDEKGRLILTEKVEANETIRVDLPGPLAAGMYFLQLNDRAPVKLFIF